MSIHTQAEKALTQVQRSSDQDSQDVKVEEVITLFTIGYQIV